MLNCAPREWAMTEAALNNLLELDVHELEEQLKSLDIKQIDCNDFAWSNYNSCLKDDSCSILASKRGELLIYLFENEVLSNKYLNREKTINEIYHAMDKHFPDNHAIIVGTMREYTYARYLYGIEDIYFWRKKNGSR